MADRAQVLSVTQLENFQQQLASCRAQLHAEIEALQLELRRLSTWLDTDVLGYWSEEFAKADRRYKECRDVLSRCMSYVREDERRPCTEEKKRVQLAEQRLELCQTKLKITRAAIQFWETERHKQQSKISRCRELAEADLQVAVHMLRDQVERLQRYADVRSGRAVETTPAQPSTPAAPPHA